MTPSHRDLFLKDTIRSYSSKFTFLEDRVRQGPGFMEDKLAAAPVVPVSTGLFAPVTCMLARGCTAPVTGVRDIRIREAGPRQTSVLNFVGDWGHT
jgi:hypothetical protein